MKLIRMVSFLLAASLAWAGGCSSPGHHGLSRASRNAVRNQSGQLRFPYDLPKSAGHFSVSLALRASEGFFAYTLTDPRGTPLWQGQVNAGQTLSETRVLKPVPGKWVLTLTMENTTGSYDAAWKSD